MAFKIFISHSVAPKELGIAYAIANEGAKRGAVPYIPDRDWNHSEEIPDRIYAHLQNADYILAIATSSGFHLEWLNKEVNKAAKEKKPILIIADNGIDVPKKLAHIWIDRTNPSKTISRVSRHLEKFGKDKETKAYIRLQEWSARGFIRIASGKKVEISIPSKFPGQPLSEYLKDMRD